MVALFYFITFALFKRMLIVTRILFGLLFLALLCPLSAQSTFVVAELNCENLFDCRHDAGMNDQDFLPESVRRWTPSRLHKKLELLGKTLVAIGGEHAPDLVALSEVENDSVMERLTRRSILWSIGYKYYITHGHDARGINVALLYRPETFRPIAQCDLRADFGGLPAKPTRDVLYVSGLVQTGDTLDVFVVHAPSRIEGHHRGRDYRIKLMQQIHCFADSVISRRITPQILIAGDFNDGPETLSLRALGAETLPLDMRKIESHRFYNLAATASSRHKKVKGTYCYKGRWETIDQILVSGNLLKEANRLHLSKAGCRIADEWFLLKESNGQLMPRRTYNGMRWQGGLSDHLPLVATFNYSW